MIFLLFPILSFASVWSLAWEVPLDGRPQAAFFSGATGEVIVSVQGTDGRASLQSLSDTGKVVEKRLAVEAGQAGPLRAYGERIYWNVGKKVFSLPLKGGRTKVEAEVGGPLHDIALSRKGELYLAGPSGLMFGDRQLLTLEVNGLFFLGTDLHALQAGKSVVEVMKSESKVKNLCDGSCVGLERASDGTWLTVKGKTVLGGSNNVLLTLPSAPGRLAYIYRRETRDDLIVLPFPDEGKVRAYKR